MVFIQSYGNKAKLLKSFKRLTDNGNNFKYYLRNKSYIFDFETKNIKLINETFIEISGFKLNGLKKAYTKILSKHGLCNDIYIVCPLYNDVTTNKLLDTQLSITGTCYVDENMMDTSIREVAEEIGIIIDKDKVEEIETKTNINRSESTYIIDIQNSKSFDINKNNFECGVDDKSRKIQIIVYGKLNDLIKTYEKVNNRPLSKESDTIKHLRFIPLKEFIKYPSSIKN